MPRKPISESKQSTPLTDPKQPANDTGATAISRRRLLRLGAYVPPAILGMAIIGGMPKAYADDSGPSLLGGFFSDDSGDKSGGSGGSSHGGGGYGGSGANTGGSANQVPGVGRGAGGPGNSYGPGQGAGQGLGNKNKSGGGHTYGSCMPSACQPCVESNNDDKYNGKQPHDDYVRQCKIEQERKKSKDSQKDN